MTISQNITNMIKTSSWIRKMFEEGARLKEEHGAENVYDFSLGNPNLDPPEKFKQALQDVAADSTSGCHAYMPNTGYPHVRKAVADFLCQEQSINITGDDIIMTCGSAGAINVILKAILDPADEVITPAPFFVEYNFYADNHGGILKPVPTKKDFTLDINAIASAITEKTKAIIINTPNNPTGQVYSEKSLIDLGMILQAAGEKYNRTIYIISDEPYRKIVYNNLKLPGIFNCYPESFIVTSYSKDISIPGERIGFIAVSPNACFKDDLLQGMTLSNRILGFVNAPALMQRVVASIQGAVVDLSAYSRKRDILCDGLANCGYEFIKPAGAFYLFPQTPIDDVEFVRLLQKELILTVPGSGFGRPGYLRIAFCVDDDTIINSMAGFKKVMMEINNR